MINGETEVKDNFIYVSFVSPRSAELGDQNLSKCPMLVPVAWESGRNGQQGSVPATGPAIKVLDTLYCSCSSTVLAVQASCVHAETGYMSVSVVQGKGSSSLLQRSVNGHGWTPGLVVQEPSRMQSRHGWLWDPSWLRHLRPVGWKLFLLSGLCIPHWLCRAAASLLRSNLTCQLQRSGRFATWLLQMAAASRGEERLWWSVNCWGGSSFRDRPCQEKALAAD